MRFGVVCTSCVIEWPFCAPFWNPKLSFFGFVSAASRVLCDLRKVVMVHLFEGPVLQDTLMRMEREKILHHSGIEPMFSQLREVDSTFVPQLLSNLLIVCYSSLIKSC